MASSLIFCSFNSLLFLTLITLFPKSYSAQALCHDNERVSLLQFKQSFLISNSASYDPTAYPKTASWGNHNESSNCCLWDGVECDKVSGYITGLDLSSSYLFGSINSTSTLFSLIHLQYLNLGDNNFSRSQIPSAISRLMKLTYLNLSRSTFSGDIPSEIAEISNLSSLDLGGNFDTIKGLLKLDSSILRKLIQKSRGLEVLNLNYVQIPSSLPDSLGNMSSLSYLNLRRCQFSGTIPSSLGGLTNLRYLNLASNSISSKMPNSLGNLSLLSYLNLMECELFGPIPPSVGDLTNLVYFNLGSNNLSGQIPSSFANLTQLRELRLFNNSFTMGKLSWLGTQNKLIYLGLSGANLVGEIPTTIRNLTNLSYLLLNKNGLTGEIPSWLSNLTQLSTMQFGSNQLHGKIPEVITKISKLQVLDLAYNHFTGTLKFEIFSSLEHLFLLLLDENNLSVVTSISKNISLPRFQYLGLNNCNLRKYPEFLRDQDKLVNLFLANNKIKGLIPRWIGNTSTETLSALILTNNFITGFEHPNVLSNLTSLQMLSMVNNRLEGPLPIPSNSILLYFAGNNSLSGEIPFSFCNLHSLLYFDLSYNKLSGKIPQCLGNFSVSLFAMNLASNSLQGSIPTTFTNESRLKMIDLSDNQLEGEMSRSLANCAMLEKLDFSENNLADEFPFWLSTLPKLEILILRSNQLFGTLGSPTTVLRFPKLRILDLSSNYFTGILPLDFFQNLSNMISNTNQFAYMITKTQTLTLQSDWGYSTTLRNKGMFLKYEKISNVIAAIDFSNNKFRGEIPQSLAMLSMVNVLDLSNNNFSGHIPSALANMTKLESLDLSLNNFSGEIPPQLIQLTFLAYFNISGNHQLVGAIPHGNQFNTFENSSYKGNPGLCGDPLTKKCKSLKPFDPANPTSQRDEDSGSSLDFGWEVVVIGYGIGLIVGVAIGYWFTIWKHAWLMKTFRIKQPRRGWGRGRRNRVVIARRS